MEFTKDTSVWDKLKRDLRLLNTLELNTGWFDKHYGPENNNLPIAQVVQFNEEGTSTAPPRPFIREGFGQLLKSGRATVNFERIISSVLNGQSVMTAYTLNGPIFVEYMKKSIRDWKTPGNAPATIAAKGFDNPLQETDTMLNAVEFKVQPK